MTEIYSGIDMCHVKLSVSFGFHQGFLNVKCLSKHAGGKSSKKLIKKKSFQKKLKISASCSQKITSEHLDLKIFIVKCDIFCAFSYFLLMKHIVFYMNQQFWSSRL